VVVSFIGGVNRSTRGNQRPAGSHWQSLSHNAVSSTPRHERDGFFVKAMGVNILWIVLHTI